MSHHEDILPALAYEVLESLASQVHHTATDGGATTSAIHCRPPSIRRARPRGLELFAGRSPCTAGL